MSRQTPQLDDRPKRIGNFWCVGDSAFESFADASLFAQRRRMQWSSSLPNEPNQEPYMFGSKKKSSYDPANYFHLRTDKTRAAIDGDLMVMRTLDDRYVLRVYHDSAWRRPSEVPIHWRRRNYAMVGAHEGDTVFIRDDGSPVLLGKATPQIGWAMGMVTSTDNSPGSIHSATVVVCEDAVDEDAIKAYTKCKVKVDAAQATESLKKAAEAIGKMGQAASALTPAVQSAGQAMNKAFDGDPWPYVTLRPGVTLTMSHYEHVSCPKCHKKLEAISITTDTDHVQHTTVRIYEYACSTCQIKWRAECHGRTVYGLNETPLPKEMLATSDPVEVEELAAIIRNTGEPEEARVERSIDI